ncbi:MAG TPA: T9SS type A sorting domain-containing protein [Bacteroidales bacterium]|nr:T9SS type A sorting domain-containing protein [Bacteroidales bacterium]
MKKFTLTILIFIAGVCLTAASFGQNLVLNGGVELWDDAQNPTDWDKAENIEQSTAVIHSGTYSAGHNSASSTKDFQQQIEGILGGTNYTISYYYYDNDAAARTRIWAYWTSGASTLDDHAEELRPSEYSEDTDEWIMWQQSLTAPATADGFRFEVRVYNQDGLTEGTVYYDDFSIEIAGNQPEPSNYPSNFTATANGLNINLTWTDATGEVVPTGYIILGEIAISTKKWTFPVDGTPIENDTDWSDGMAAMNVPYGVENYTFNNLEGETAHQFYIYPYSNGGTNIDYKTDGTVPAAYAETPAAIVINQADFNNDWNGWTPRSIIGDQVWNRDNTYGINNTPCAQMSGYSGSAMENEDWLISPAIDLTSYTNIVFSFFTAMNYTGPELEVYFSTDYPGPDEDPNTATWTQIQAPLSPGGWAWTSSGDLPVNAQGTQLFLAFKYTSLDAAATWEVDNIVIIGEYKVGIEAFESTSLPVYPNPATKEFQIGTGNQTGYIEILSLTGKTVKELHLNNSNQPIPVENLTPGLYIVKFSPDNAGANRIAKIMIR